MANSNRSGSLPELHSASPRDRGSGPSSDPASADTSRPGSIGSETPRARGHKRVGFSVGGSSIDDEPMPPQPRKPLPSIRLPPGASKDRLDPSIANTDVAADVTDVHFTEPLWSENLERRTTVEKETSQYKSQQRAQKLANRLGSGSAPATRRNSVDEAGSSGSSPSISGNIHGNQAFPVKIDDIPLVDLERRRKDLPRRPYSLAYESDDTEDELDQTALKKPDSLVESTKAEGRRFAKAMRRAFTPQKRVEGGRELTTEPPTPEEGEVKPQGGLHLALLQLYNGGVANAIMHGSKTPRKTQKKASSAPGSATLSPSSPVHSGHSSTPGSGATTPSKRPKWYKNPSAANSATSMSRLLDHSATPPVDTPSVAHQPGRPGMPRPRSSGHLLDVLEHKFKHHKKSPPKPEVAINVDNDFEAALRVKHLMNCQDYMVILCRALMMYGAPTHRLEEYLAATAKIIGLVGSFMYLPNCMVISFEDPVMHTSDVRLIKELQGVNLSKFHEVHDIYKLVIHEVIGVNEATADLKQVMEKPDKYPVWMRILFYGAGSVCVGPFAFGARPTDFPICFVLGCILGWLNLVGTRSDNFVHVLEIVAAVITSFVARAFGSIRVGGEYLFCYSAIAQASIALILPGFIILCGALELMSRNFVSGSVHIVYAIIYALFLGFGITIGSALFGVMYRDAVTDVTCAAPSYYHFWTNHVYVSHFPFVPLFTLCLIAINNGNIINKNEGRWLNEYRTWWNPGTWLSKGKLTDWKPTLVTVSIAFGGYQVNYWSSNEFAKSNIQIANALGALAIGSMANVYSRWGRGLAAAALLPAIFVQVPSGLAAGGSLVAGLISAEQITGNATGIGVVNNGTQGFLDASNSTESSSSNVYSGTIYNVGYGMVQVAIGISVGLFMSVLVFYPKGKKRSALFSF